MERKIWENTQFLIAKHYSALDQIVDHRFTLERASKSDNKGLIFTRWRLAIAPWRTDSLTDGASVFPHGSHLFDGHVTAIGMASRDKCVHCGAMGVSPGMLIDGRRIGIEAEPREPIQNHLYGALGRPLTVRVFDAQKKLPAVVTGIEPIEQRRPRRADVHGAGGRGGDTGDDRCGHRGVPNGREGAAHITAWGRVPRAG